MSRDGITMPLHRPDERHHQDQQERAEIDAADQDRGEHGREQPERRDQRGDCVTRPAIQPPTSTPSALSSR